MAPPTTPARQRGPKQAASQFAAADDSARKRKKSEAVTSPRNTSYSCQHRGGVEASGGVNGTPPSLRLAWKPELATIGPLATVGAVPGGGDDRQPTKVQGGGDDDDDCDDDNGNDDGHEGRDRTAGGGGQRQWQLRRRGFLLSLVDSARRCMWPVSGHLRRFFAFPLSSYSLRMERNCSRHGGGGGRGGGGALPTHPALPRRGDVANLSIPEVVRGRIGTLDEAGRRGLSR
jgi:hypothetical protein